MTCPECGQPIPEAATAPTRELYPDGMGLAYSRQGRQLYVHYPQPGGEFGAGLAFEHEPELARNPSSDRAQLWLAILSLKPYPGEG